MPFPDEVREEALVRSRRSCCVCHVKAGRNIEVHHIVQEADKGANTIDNAIALCFRCHSEAGHYNARHPKGTKYSISELIRHRDAWWAYCENYDSSLRPDGYSELPDSGRSVGVHSLDVGILSSGLANVEECVENIEFEGKLLAKIRLEDVNGPRWYELYQVSTDRYLVYVKRNFRGDYVSARLDGADPSDRDTPLTTAEVQERYPGLAKKAGIIRVRRLKQ